MFQEESYKRLGMSLKYLLAILYSLSDEYDYLTVRQVDLARMLGVSRKTINDGIIELSKNGFLSMDSGKTIKLFRPQNREIIPINEELIFGKYKNLSYGSKIFYIYYLYLQKQNKKGYILIKGTEIGKPVNRNIRTIQKYYKELESVGLLIKDKELGINKLQFIEI